MGGFLLRKSGAALIVLALASIVVFLGVRALPGDPALALGGENRDPEVLAAIRHDYGLDRPLPIQYVTWVGHVLRGDLGTDQRKLPVGHTIVTRLPITLELAFLAVLFGSLIGIGAGIIAATRRGKTSDYAATSVALVGLSVPHFWLGLLLIVLFSVRLQWLPAGGYVPFFEDPVDNLRHMLLPAIVLGTGLSAVVMRQMRSAMLDSLGADYVRTARAKGLPEGTVVYRHAARNGMMPIVTLLAGILPALIGGSILVEYIFNLRGMGLLTIEAINQKDYNVVMGESLFVAVLTLLGILLSDVFYAVIDPRISYS